MFEDAEETRVYETVINLEGKISKFYGEIRATEEALNFEHVVELRDRIVDFRGEIDKDYLVSKGFIFSQTVSTLTFAMQGAGSPSLIGYTQSQLQP